uniref:Uncharacterized protein n=1 Tax=Glossina palpalis gambiensis TaxID=67801 RepID=A0A1B0ATL2_9MUSC
MFNKRQVFYIELELKILVYRCLSAQSVFVIFVKIFGKLLKEDVFLRVENDWRLRFVHPLT